MKQEIVPLLIVASFALACSSTEKTPAAVAARPAQAPKTVPMAPILAKPAARAAQEEKPAAAATEPRADRLAALEKEYSDALDAYYTAYEAAMGDNKSPTVADLQKLAEKVHEPDFKPFLARAQTLIDEDTTDITAFHAIVWLLDNDRTPEARPPLIALIEKHHLKRPEMGDVCARLQQHDRALLERLLASSTHAEVRGRACMALAESLKSDAQSAERLKTASQEDRDRYVTYMGAAKVEALDHLDVQQTEKDTEALYKRVAREFTDVKLYAGTKRETTLGKQASAALFEVRNLALGQPAPEIEGSDLDKIAFKLSDYRGKVVLLDFWGNW